MSAIFDFIDSNQLEKKWSRQGLGVWTDNLLAINAYEKLGFSFAGEKMLRGQQGRFFQHMVRNSQL
jgi:ribosomal protein S18 acetylase RimI-like enzyme